MFRSIRWRLILSFMLVTLLAVAVVGSVSYQIVEHYVHQREIEGLRDNAQVIAKQAYPYLWPVVQWEKLSELVQTSAFLGDFRVRILDKQNRVLVDSGSPQAGNNLILVMPLSESISRWFPGSSPPLFFLQDGKELTWEFQPPSIEGLPSGISITVLQRSDDPWGGGYQIKDWVTSGELSLDIVEQVKQIARSETSLEFSIGDTDYPLGYVELSALPDYGSKVLLQVRQALIFGGGGAVLLAGVVGLWISHRLASPLKDLASSSAEMGAGDLSIRATVKSKDEIGELAQQFNYMAERLETSFQQLADERDSLRRFISDASHELRTPITALKNFNALLQGKAGEDPQRRTEFLVESQVQIDRLGWITGNLLDLTRLDAGLLTFDSTEHDLREVTDAVAGTFKPMAAEKSITLSVANPDSPCLLYCDRSRLEIALSNVVDNAIKFTPDDGEIEIGVSAQEDTRVWVRDNGIGIPPDELPHVFERFYRGRGHDAGGSGLGLAIARSLIEAQGGQVSIDSVVDKGTTVRFTWLLG